MKFLPGRRMIHEVDKTGSLYYLFNALIGAVNRLADVCSADTLSARLDVITEMIERQAGVPAELQLIQQRLEIIHGLLQNLPDTAQIQTQIDEFTRSLRASSDTVDAAIEQNTERKDSN